MPEKPRADAGSWLGKTLEVVQVAVYLVAAIFLLILVIMAFIVVIGDIGNIIREPSSILLIDIALENLLVVFVITGLIQTLMVYIKTHEIDPVLVLGVGLTAIIRRVLVFGARPKAWEEIALTAVFLFILVLGLYLIGRRKKPE